MSQQKIKIEKNVPMPTRSAVPPLPLGEMKVGDSFELRVSSDRDKTTIRQRLHRFQKRNVPARFSMRTINEDAVRIFRVEDDE